MKSSLGFFFLFIIFSFIECSSRSALFFLFRPSLASGRRFSTPKATFVLYHEVRLPPLHLAFLSLQTLSVLNPFRATDKNIFEDTDLAGPLVFCLAFGGFLLLVSFPKEKKETFRSDSSVLSPPKTPRRVSFAAYL
jgi:hypothetical protein